MPLEGQAYDMDNKTVYQKLKSFLNGAPGWAWMEDYDAAEDGHGAFQAWADHYNGQGELSKCTKLVKAKIQSLYYKNEKVLPFEDYSAELMHCFQVLEMDPEERLSECQKVSTLKAGIRTDDVELKASKSVILNDYANNFTGACAYFSGLVTDLHGDAQLEYVSSTGSGHGRGCGCFRGHGGCRGCGHGVSGTSNAVIFNGIDVTQYTWNFTSEEWQQMGGAGHTYVNQQHSKRNNDGGHGVMAATVVGDPGASRSHGDGNGEHNVGSIKSGKPDGTGGGNNSSMSGDRGRRNGHGFGCGTYGRDN